MTDQQGRFGPPPVRALNFQIMWVAGGYQLVVRVLREGAGWQPSEQTVYARCSYEEVAQIVDDELWARRL